MTEVVQVGIIEPKIDSNGIVSFTSTSTMVLLPSTPTSIDYNKDASKIETKTIENSCSEESEKTMLKILLSTSSPTAVASTTTTAATALSASIESMITKEVNDTQLNLTKILYEPDKGDTTKEKDQEGSAVIGLSNSAATDTQIIDDDDRLVIDISDDDQKEGSRKRKRPNTKPNSMPLLETTRDLTTDKTSKSTVWSSRCHRTDTLKIHLIKKHKKPTCVKSMKNQIPRTFSYSFDAASLGVSSSSNSVKIDIFEQPLAIQSNITSSTTTMANEVTRVVPNPISSSTSISSSASSSKYANLSSLDELNLLTHEVDKQITKKTNEVLELVKEFLGGLMDIKTFQLRMLENGNIAMSDLTLISKKLIKRHKFEANPNQRDFMRVKQLQFPTSAKDLVNYFEKLVQSITMEQFTKMTKFYEIIIKEMLNLNRTKMLQYLIDFMVIRKNAQLDLLNFNFHTDSSPKIQESVAATSTTLTYEVPDSTQTPKIEHRQWRMRDTSYNFVIRSDPIYVTAGSPMQTTYRDMTKYRISTRQQKANLQRRPFDNNILRGRRIANRLVSNKEDENYELTPPPLNGIQKHGNFQFPVKLKINNDTLVQKSNPGKAIILPTTPNKDENATIITPIFKSPNTQNSSSPILVESDSPPSTSPPIHKIHKPQIISNQLLTRAFNERVVVESSTSSSMTQKIAFPGLHNNNNNNEDASSTAIECSTTFIKQQFNRPSTQHKIAPLVPHQSSSSMDPIEGSQITLNELKTLTQNGTEIIPTSILKGNVIRTRRKTVDERSQINGGNVEMKKVVAVAPTSAATISFPPTLQSNISPSANQKKVVKRRMSCHERLSSMPPSSSNSSSLSQNFQDFMIEYEKRTREEEMRINRLRQHHYQEQQKQLQMQHQQNMPLYQQHKRVRFNHENSHEIPRSLQISKSQLAVVTQQHLAQQQPRSPIEHPRVFQLSQRSPTMRSPTMRSPSKPPPIDYQQHLQFFEREMRERGVDRIETLNDREMHSRSVELVSNIQPDRYMQNEQQQQALYAKSLSDKSLRLQSRAPGGVNDEKLVAYHQLQSLLKDPSAMNFQQYSEHLKHLHMKQQQVMDERRESFYQNTQQVLQQQQQQMQQKSPTLAQYRSPPGQQEEYNQEQQSLQIKLITKTKSSKYIEPSVIGSKPFYNPPHSTYYSDPFVPTSTPTEKKSTPTTPTTPTTLTAFHPPLENISQQSPQFYKTLLGEASPSYPQWIYQHHQQQHTALPSPQGQLARPIPRPAIPQQQPPALYSDPKINGLPHHPSLQTFINTQSDYYRHYFPKSY